jgi:hypothetical protein
MWMLRQTECDECMHERPAPRATHAARAPAGALPASPATACHPFPMEPTTVSRRFDP